MKCTAVAALFFSVLMWTGNVLACSTIMRATEDRVMVGYNLDTGSFYPKIWFIPAADGQYGGMCYGNGDFFQVAEGGMNDQGLYIAVNALNQETGWKGNPDLPDWETWAGWFGTGVPDGILAKCATVSEAVVIFKQYNLFTFRNVKFLLADRRGGSVVIEWHDGKLRFHERGDENFQVSTNVLTARASGDKTACYRFTLARTLFKQEEADVSVGFFRGILSAVHLEFGTPTVYSNICDLTTGDVTIYYFHNFEEGYGMNLHEKLKEGRSAFLVRDLFTVKPYVAQVYEDYDAQQKAAAAK